MPFISSVSGSKGGLIWRLSNVSLPTIAINSTTNYNQDRATFNATVNPNGGATSVKFQYSTNGSSWTDGSTISNITGASQSTYSNQTGLSVNTLYYVRAIATNSAGSVTSSNTTFTTWSLKTYANATAGTYYLTIPTITPTGGSTIAPTIYNVFILGGGGGAGYYGGGGGGGYRLVSSRSFTNTSNTQLTLVVGAGGAVNTTGDTGGTTQITAGNFTSIDAGGGTGGVYSNGYGGNAGYGDNGAYTGGVYASYGYSEGKTNLVWTGYGGGAGIGGYGGNGVAGGSGSSGWGYGGTGGTGGSAYGYNGGAGGGGVGSTANGSNGSYYGYGSGGTNLGNGTAGLIYFQYYGA